MVLGRDRGKLPGVATSALAQQRATEQLLAQQRVTWFWCCDPVLGSRPGMPCLMSRHHF